MPSTLVPKAEKGEFRLVTNFQSLNTFLKKLPGVSPLINEAKEKIAKFRYHVFLDYANWYYQAGVKVEDSQFLTTIHPFKGMMCYTRSPQGLLNSGEISDEILAKIYGDMQADERITRQADGMFVLADSYEDLLVNLREVFERARKANLTFKPSKILVCPADTVVFGWRKQGDAW